MDSSKKRTLESLSPNSESPEVLSLSLSARVVIFSEIKFICKLFLLAMNA